MSKVRLASREGKKLCSDLNILEKNGKVPAIKDMTPKQKKAWAAIVKLFKEGL